MAGIILHKTIIMLILMLVGVLCAKSGIISQNGNSDLSRFVLQVVNPVMIFMSYQTDLDSRLVHNLLISFLVSFGTFLILIAGAYLLIRKKDGRETEIERFAAIYSNCGFMGIPLVDAMFGGEGVLYLTGFITVFNLLVWSHGVILLSGQKSIKQVLKVFTSPTIISIFLGIITFFAGFRLPDTPSQALTLIKELNTPLAMVVSGVTISQTRLSDVIHRPGIFRVCLVRLLIIPAVISLALVPFSIDQKVMLTVVIAASAPPAAMCTLLSMRYGRDSVYASQIFAAGTILSVITLPIITKFTEYLTKNLT
ncbi:MAG: AEC family transporter [Ruminococcus sp.]|nr:AEC family transporter [Ruminococcus sp.]